MGEFLFSCRNFIYSPGSLSCKTSACMDSLKFAHGFFDFSINAWEDFERSGIPLSQLFHKAILPKRSLRFPHPESLEEALERLSDRELDVEIISYRDPSYPEALLALGPDRPPVLYKRGAALPPRRSLIGIVGTRVPSEFGVREARRFARAVVGSGFGTVSGLAYGIDAIAHEESLPDYTLAILGSSAVEIYPKENAALAEEILLSGGTLLSPYPEGQVPLPQNFPRRNRLIAAFSAGIIVIEGAEKSGALLTGRYALESGATAVCLPQDFRTPAGRGAIQLLENGATAVRSEEDALHAIAFPWGGLLEPLHEKFCTPQRLAPWKRSFHLKDYCRKHGLTEPQAAVELSALEREGWIMRRENGRYQRRTAWGVKLQLSL